MLSHAAGPGGARAVLGALADFAAGCGDAPLRESLRTWRGDPAALADDLARFELGPLAYFAARHAAPDLARRLARDAFGAAAANLGHFAALDRVERAFAAERIPCILLKGASVAMSAYADPSYRPMTDVDLWVPDADMTRAASALERSGFRRDPGLAHRPPALQRRSGGEVVFRPEGGGHGLVELHYGPFAGWWIQRTAAPDLEGMLCRAEPAGPGRHALRLAAEDAVLQTAFHVAVNQFGQAPLRGMMDLAVIARREPIDWVVVAERAAAWRLAHAAWIVFDTADRLVGLPGCGEALVRLRPAAARRAVLRAFVTPAAVLDGRDLTRPIPRHAFMLALVVRGRDGARLVARAVWPERWWIDARHGGRRGRFGHLLEILRRAEA